MGFDLPADEKRLYVRQMDVFAAYVAYTDHEIGRVIQAIDDMGKLDNTLIIYIAATTVRAPKAPTARPNALAAYSTASTFPSRSK